MAKDTDGRRLRLLIDTNIVIAHEDDEDEPHTNARRAQRLVREARDLGFEVLISHGTVQDVLRADEPRRSRRRSSLNKHYTQLRPVSPDPDLRERFPPNLEDNDSSDLQILSVFATDAAIALVTEDRKMRNRAAQAGLKRVLNLDDALDWLAGLRAPELRNAAGVERVEAYQIPLRAPIFDSLRHDYPDFEGWWRDKVVDQRRTVLVLGDQDAPEGVAVLKDESDESDLADRVLKISTFKVAEGLGRARRGELLLRAVVDHAVGSGFDAAYLTVWEHHGDLIGWLGRFGFFHHGATAEGELVLAKHFVPPPGAAALAPLPHHVAYGPRSLRVERVFWVPIQDRFHSRLLPDSDEQRSLMGNEACGNAIRKAYLCRANTRQLRPGDTLGFLRTGAGTSRVTAVGVVENTLASRDPTEVAAFVTGRTVYSLREIRRMCEVGEVLAVLFRFDRRLEPPWLLDDLKQRGALNGPPQSITAATEEGTTWVREQLGG